MVPGLFRCDGVAEFKADIRAKELIIDGVVSLKGEMKLEAGHCFGGIQWRAGLDHLPLLGKT